jgi:membrane protein implicated in regulation of membrane protease activity
VEPVRPRDRRIQRFAIQHRAEICYTALHMDLSSPIARLLIALFGGVALILLARFARRLPDPLRSFVRLSVGEASFTEIVGVFLIGYAIGSFVGGPDDASGGSSRGPGGVVGRFRGLGRGGVFGGSVAVATGFVLAALVFLYRIDILSKITNPQSHKSVAAIIGSDAEAMEDIPAGGHGQIRFRDPGGTLVGVMAAADVDVPRGSWVRIVGTKGLNPLVVPKTRTGARG